MAYGAYALNTIQLGREDYPGTPVAATSVWRGPAVDIEDQSETALAEEDIGLLPPGARSYISKAQAVLALPETELTFEQVLHLLEGGIGMASVAGGNLYIPRVYAFPTNPNTNEIKTYTLETGNANAGDANYMSHSFVEEMSFSGAAGEAWKMSGTWRGLQKTPRALTAAPTLIVTEPALFSKTTLTIDDAVLGDTAMAGVMTAASVNIKTGVQAVYSADGQIYFYAHKFVRPEVTWSISLELENTSNILATERAAWVAGTLRLIRLNCPGSTSARNLTIDLVGKYTSFSAFNNQDGNTVVEASGVCRYDATYTQYCTITVVCGAGGVAITNGAVAVTNAAAAVWQSDMAIS